MTDDEVVDELIRIVDANGKNHDAAKLQVIVYLDKFTIEGTDTKISPARKSEIVEKFLGRFARRPNTAIANDNSSYLKVGNDTYAYYLAQVKK